MKIMGIKVRTRNTREEKFVRIVKRQIEQLPGNAKKYGYSMDNDFDECKAYISSMYFLGMILEDEFTEIYDRLTILRNACLN